MIDCTCRLSIGRQARALGISQGSAVCSDRIAKLECALRLEAARGEVTARLQTMPGVGPITARAVEPFAPPMASFRRGRDFAAWLGLVRARSQRAAT